MSFEFPRDLITNLDFGLHQEVVERSGEDMLALKWPDIF